MTDTNPPLDYRRFAALTGSHIKKPIPANIKRDSEGDGEKPPVESPPAQPPKPKPPVKPPQKVFEQLQTKLDGEMNDPKTLIEFIKIGYELAEYETIKEYMKSYLSIHPRDNGIRFNLGMTLIKMGEVRKAKIEFRKILSFNPKFQPARDILEKFRISGEQQ